MHYPVTITVNKKELEDISEIQLEKYISSGWIDFREKTVKTWLNKLQKLQKEKSEILSEICIPLEKNWQNITGENIGEILGYIYSMEGGNRKKEL